ncbi:DNA (cytosine-5-)-methyltransferase [Kitasatospora sp. YST-16]|uniref:DNA cytosine methyltransferase n=1 Tax=Kitasatospora sp. YST-16 TaxID=2998080 RepID=UPI002283C079|nr:DNA (cytosine-5-)-methyltransferase [Kitasatospora sp. YST-16]WAL72308.1 DNA (cytosine-5-)-methyltransferase [Kitasatospora sp. YST-16]WNW38355.1 DNA (cytosine-5-)-methyltransferase [Streptomyces sp. Li-HN-5-13]
MPKNTGRQAGLFAETLDDVTADDTVVPSLIPSTSPFHQPRELTATERERFRRMSQESRRARQSALAGEGPEPLHEINFPRLDPFSLMPQRPASGLRSLSLFSGGGGLDLGFERAGFEHMASYEIMEDAAATLQKARPDWEVHGGADGDVRRANFKQWRGKVDILHGGPPCQPFSNAGRQRGHLDERDMWPEFVRAVKEINPVAFVGENVPALAGVKFSEYVKERIIAPLSPGYHISRVILQASDFGVPQVRRRVFFVGFRNKRSLKRWNAPSPSHFWGEAPLDSDIQRCMGLREALGLPDIGVDDLSPTIRSGLTGPRHTTSILNSVAAQKRFETLEIWPNGVAASREAARSFVAKNGHFRLSIPDVALIQGFPQDWPFVGATYMALGQIGNAVPPPLAYAVACSVSAAV